MQSAAQSGFEKMVQFLLDITEWLPSPEDRTKVQEDAHSNSQTCQVAFR